MKRNRHNGTSHHSEKSRSGSTQGQEACVSYHHHHSRVTLLIGLVAATVIAVIGGFYYMIFAAFPQGWLGGAAVVIATCAVLGALAYVVWQRLHEIAQEDPDDYRKY